MNNRLIVEVQSALVERLTEKIYENLNFHFSVGVNDYDFVSDKIKDALKQEIEEALCELTSIQYAHLSAFSSEDVDKITMEMAGTLHVHGSFNVITGQGIEVTGLTKTYFNSLSCKVYDFVCDTFLLGVPGNTETKVATYDELKGSMEERHYAIQSSFNQFFSSITHAHSRLVNKISNQIYENLNFKFSFGDGSIYVYVSENMKNIFKQEIQSTLSPFTLTPTQYAIFSTLSVEDLDKFVAGMVGTLVRNCQGKVLSGNGIIATRLTGIYFNALSCNIAGFAHDAYYGYGSVYSEYPYHSATRDQLKSNYEERKTAILLSFGQQLILRATPDQHKELCLELKDNDNQLVIALQTPVTSFTNLFSRGTRKNNYLTFENQLFGLTSYATFFCKAISLLIANNSMIPAFPTDAYHFFGSFFSVAEHRIARNVFPRINKAIAQAKEDEVEKLRIQYR